MNTVLSRVLKAPFITFPVLVLLILAPWALAIQYQAALPGYRFEFPRDHAAHPAYKTEWWYYTGHLQTESGLRYGYELTFFRVGVPTESATLSANTWQAENVYAAHFALSDLNQREFIYDEKLNRPALNIAGARKDVYYVWNELWLAEQLGDAMVLRAATAEGRQALHLMLTPQKPPVVHGQNGVSQKANCAGCASHYYSLTRLDSRGLLMLGDEAHRVSGLSWMDHEFGSNQLGKNQVGWDWFSIQLADGTDVMLYLLRQTDGRLDPNSSGTIVYPSGQSRHLALADFGVTHSGRFWQSPRTGARYPLGWQIRIPSESLALSVTPAFENQELSTTGSTGVAYWEGASTVTGAHRGAPVQGQAYVEMTGYAPDQGVQNKF